MQKLSIPDTSGIKPRARVGVIEEYLDWVLQELLALGHLLVCAVGTKLYKKESELFTRAVLNAARDLSIQRASHASKAVCNYEEVRTEIEEWDTSGLGASISHCKPVLLDDMNAAYREVERIISQGSLSRFEVVIDPLYKNLVKLLTVNQQGTVGEAASDDTERP
ncbi:hypothetical protein ACFYVK_33180 [Streptomyces chartreusis]|uniref:hypothetical protein n=1 Tax=Streptomyces chartreusis TaxID=1969 RepID=UPI0036A607C8